MFKEIYRKTFTYDGKRYDVTAKSEPELYTKMALRKRDLDEGKTTINGNTKSSAWIDKWLETYKQNSVKDITYTNIKSKVNHNITSEIGSMLIKDVKPVHCQKILNDLSGFSDDHIKKVHNYLFDIFDKAIDNKMILNNPAAKLARPKGYKNSFRAITDNERKYILQVAERHRAGLWVLIMLYCGLRPEETSLIQGRHLKLKEGDLHIPGTKSKNADRLVPIPVEIMCRLPKLEPFQYLFVNSKGNRISDNNRGDMWHNFKREMNIAMGCTVYRSQLIPPFPVADDLVPYCMRHTFCTDLQAAGVPINVAKELMGHSDISLTSRIYTHRSETAYNNAKELINKFHSPKEENREQKTK